MTSSIRKNSHPTMGALAILAACGMAAHALGETHYVAPGGGNLPPYTNWATAARHIQDALDVASSGDTVVVSNGLYLLSAPLSVTNAVWVRSANGWAVTIVDGGHSVRCFRVTHPGAALEGFTIRNGYTAAEGTNAFGAGVFMPFGGTVRDCRIEGCLANGQLPEYGIGYTRGGGAYCALTGLIENCVVVGNTAKGGESMGGGLFVEGNVIVRGCLIASNACYGGVQFWYIGKSGYGGGVYAGAGAEIVDCVISGNLAKGYCGMYAKPGQGGGVYCQDAAVRRCVISDNVALGGGMHRGTGGGRGGGVHLAGTGVVENSLIARNRAEEGQGGEVRGGGIAAGYSWVPWSGCVRHCTVVDNTAAGSPWMCTNGGLDVEGDAPGVVENSILYSNTCVTGADPWESNWSGTNGVFRYVCTTPNPADALPDAIGCFTNNPLFADPSRGDYRLTRNSPCVDAGTNAPGAEADVDLSGGPRLRDGNRDGIPIVDLGAYEYTEANLALALRTRAAVLGPGSTLSYFLSVSNQGPDPARAAAVALSLPQGTTWLGANSQTGSFEEQPDVVWWQLGDLSEQDAATAVVHLAASAAGVYVLRAEAIAITADPTLTNNVAEAEIRVVSAPIVYVDAANESGIEDGTLEHPFRTIGGGIDAAPNGGWVCVRPGTYGGGIRVMQRKNLTVWGEPPDTVVTGHDWYGFQFEECSNVLVRGFRVLGGMNGVRIWYSHSVMLLSNELAGAVQNSYQAGGALYVRDSSSLRIEGNWIHDNYGGQYGGAAFLSGSSADFVGNRIVSNTAWNSAGGVWISTWNNSRLQFSGNFWQANLADYSGALQAEGRVNLLLDNNIFTDCGTDHSWAGAVKLTVQTDSVVRVVNNVFDHVHPPPGYSGAPKVAIYVSGMDPSLYVANNVFVDDGGYAIYCVNTAQQSTVEYNVVWGMDHYNVTPGPGQIQADPQLAVDFSPTGSSPCIDGGTPAADVTADRRGIPRPLDGNADGTAAWDIGAYEYVHPTADTDGDTLADASELASGTSPLDQDTDDDGMGDAHELRAGTDPTDWASLLMLEASATRGNQEARPVIRWPSASGRLYTLLRASDPVAFEPLLTHLLATPPLNVVTDETAQGSGPYYYRVKLED